MKFRTIQAMILVSWVGFLASACLLIGSTGPSPIELRVGPTPTPSPKGSPTATPSPTPVDPCKPLVGVQLGGPTEVAIGSTFKIDVTPVSASGPLEGQLDYCQNGRFVVIEALSANLRCVGACQGFGPQFLAQGVGAFSITVRVEGASANFSGTVR